MDGDLGLVGGKNLASLGRHCQYLRHQESGESHRKSEESARGDSSTPRALIPTPSFRSPVFGVPVGGVKKDANGRLFVEDSIKVGVSGEKNNQPCPLQVCCLLVVVCARYQLILHLGCIESRRIL